MCQISADNHTKEDGSKEESSILQDNLDDQCVRRDTTPFVGITILSTHINWILMNMVQEIRSGFGLEFTLMSGFGTTEMRSNGIWAYYLLPINEYLSIEF